MNQRPPSSHVTWGPGPAPRGWFCVGLSDELQPGQAVPRVLGGRDVVLFRTASGRPALLDAHCPHLGAHLGYGGFLDGEHLVCPFHGFRFEATGACLGPAGTERPPQGADLQTTPVVEQGGLLFAWSDPDHQPPTWRLPAWEEDGWSPIRGGGSTITTHPQETSENSVDLLHFAQVHGYQDVQITEPVHVQGQHLSITYTMRRRFRRAPWLSIPVTFHVDVWGLGLSIVSIGVPGTPLQARAFILATATRAPQSFVRVATQIRFSGPVGSALTPRNPVTDLTNRALMHNIVNEVEQDREMWEHKAYARTPRLAREDGPIGRYRAYARQFMPAGQAA